MIRLLSKLGAPRTVAASVLLTGLLITALAANAAIRSEIGAGEAAWRQHAELATRTFVDTVGRALRDMDTLAALFTVHPAITDVEFHRFLTQRADAFGLLHRVGWAPWVPDARRGVVEARLPGGTILDMSVDGLVPAAAADHYVPLAMIHPLVDGANPFGFNAWSSDVRRQTLERARVTRMPQLAPPVNVVGAGRAGPLTIAYAPVFRATDPACAPSDGLCGFAVVLLDVSALMERIPVLSETEIMRSVPILDLRDRGPDGALSRGNLLYWYAPALDGEVLETRQSFWGETFAAPVRTSVSLNVPGRVWSLTVSGRLPPPVGLPSLVLAIVLVGLALSGLLAAYLFTVMRSERRLAAELEHVRELEESVLGHSQFGELVARMSGRLIEPSRPGMDDVIAEALDGLCDFAGADLALVAERDGRSLRLIATVVSDSRGPRRAITVIDLDACHWAGERLRGCETVTLSREDAEARSLSGELALLRRLGLTHMLLAPIDSNNTLVGALVIGSRRSVPVSPCWQFHDLWQLAAQAIGHAQERSEMSLRLSQTEQLLIRLAETDAETGLPNAAALRGRLQNAPAGAVLAYVRFEHLYLLDSTQAEDRRTDALAAVVRRFETRGEEGDIIARVDDEALAVVRAPTVESADPVDALAMARSLLRAATGEVLINGQEVRLAVAIGVVDGRRVHAVPDFDWIRAGRLAAEQARELGQDQIAVFDPASLREGSVRVGFESRLKRAIDNGDLRLFYQPQFDPTGQRCVGAEGLLRWHDAEQGDISPGVFIPHAENYGLMPAISQRVFECARADLQAWAGQGVAVPPIAINISAGQFRDANLADQIAALIAASPTGADGVELEITEGALADDLRAVNRTMSALRELGVRLYIDDFGTGYSSMAYVKHLPVHGLKFDRVFVRDVLVDRHDRAILDAVATLAGSLGLDTVAEGVETAGQLAHVAKLGCSRVQGFYFSRAVDRDTLARQFCAPGR